MSGPVTISLPGSLKEAERILALTRAAMVDVAKGSFAMRQAMVNVAASSNPVLGDKQREVFKAQQVFADNIAIADLKIETQLLKDLAAAAADATKQKQIMLAADIAKAQRNAAPESRREIEEVYKAKAAAAQEKEKADAQVKAENESITKATAFAKETFKGFFTEVQAGLKKGQDLWETFGTAARNALTKITDKVVELVSNKLLKELFDGLDGGGGSSGGAGGSGSGGGFFDFLGKGLRALATYLFADGGIMTSRGPVPLRRYAGGGIATSPQLAMFGEGSVPEAYVPVPSGRIPVELRGGGSARGAMTVQTNISVNMAAPVARDGQGSSGNGGRGGNMMEQARELGAIVTAMVNKNLQDQMRPGGLLNPSGSFSAGVVQ